MGINVIKYYNSYKNKLHNLSKEEFLEIRNTLNSINEINSIEEANSFLRLLSAIREHKTDTMDDGEIKTIVEAFSGGDSGLYSANRNLLNDRFIYELIQNVDDCKYKDLNNCKLSLDFIPSQDKLVLEYNENGFMPNNVIAITTLGGSTKNRSKAINVNDVEKKHITDLQEIGEKGIGFKSIFGLAKKVIINSNYFSFEIHRDNFYIPVLHETSESFVGKTKLELYLDDNCVNELFNFLKDKYNKQECLINENPILFLHKLTEIKYNNVDNNTYFGFRTTRGYTQNDNNEIYIEYFSSKKEDNVKIKALRYNKKINYSIEECKSRYGQNENKDRVHDITIIAPLELDNFKIGRIYSFFATEEKVLAPFIIHAPFKLNAGRTRIDSQSNQKVSENKWFCKTKNETINFIKTVYESLAKRIGNQICNYIPIDTLVETGCSLNDIRIHKNSIVEWNLFNTVDNLYLPASEVCCLSLKEGTIENAIEIHKLIDANKSLLKFNPLKVNEFIKQGIEEIKNYEYKLLITALFKEDLTKKCIPYLTKYRPDFLLNRGLNLYVSQMLNFSKLSNIYEWLQECNNRYLKDPINNSKYEIKIETRGYEKENLSEIYDFCSEYGDSINLKFTRYLSNVSYFDVNLKKPFFAGNCILGSNKLKDAAKLYEIFSGKDDVFYSLLSIESFSSDIDKLCEDDSRENGKFLEKLYNSRVNQKRTFGIQYKSILELINNAGTNIDRFFPEILQNIDDCEYEEEPNVNIEIRGSKLKITYNELGFTKKQIRAITAIGDSTKKILLSKTMDSTGEKGIGFKSIFNICKSVEIHSNDFHFSLEKEAPTIPKIIKDQIHTNGTIMNYQLMSNEVEKNLLDIKFVLKHILCLKKIKFLSINGTKYEIIEDENCKIVYINSKEYRFDKYEHSFEVPQYILDSREKELMKKQKIIYYLNTNKEISNYLYTTFPTQHEVNVPLIINAPFVLDTARERVLIKEKWNEYLFGELKNGYFNLLNSIKNKNIYLYLPRKNEDLIDKIPIKNILNEISSKYIFKVFNSNTYTNLINGFITNEFEYYLIKEVGYINKSGNKVNYVDHLLNLSSAESIEFFENYSDVRRRSNKDMCEKLNNSISGYNLFSNNIISKNHELRSKLYDYLSNVGAQPLARISASVNIKSWEIIPIKQINGIKYIKFDNDIYYQGQDKINYNIYSILDESIMPRKLFDDIFAYISGSYHTIKQFNQEVLIGSLLDQVKEILRSDRNQFKAEELLKLYNKDKTLFKEMVKNRNDFNKNSVFFQTKNNKYLEFGKCLNRQINEVYEGFNHLIIHDNYKSLADVLGLPNIEDLKKISNLPLTISYTHLKTITDKNQFKYKQDLFGDIIDSFDYLDDSLKSGVGFMKLFGLISFDKKSEFKKNVTVDVYDELLLNNTKLVDMISQKFKNITFRLDNINLANFEYDNLLDEIQTELFKKRETDNIKLIMDLLENVYFTKSIKGEYCLINSCSRLVLLINSIVQNEYETIEVLKKSLKNIFGLDLEINRNITPYTRYGYERICKIEYNDETVDKAIKLSKNISVSDIEVLKDFLCKPIEIDGKTYGGYAKTCPLCGTRVHTELTGMRIYKTKINGQSIYLISCSNCHENLRYAKEVDINIESLYDGILNMRCDINGYEWQISNKKIKLAHMALLKREKNKGK